MDVAHEEGVHCPGEAVADGGVEVVGNGVAHASVEPHDGLALTAGGVLGKGHHLPGQALSRPVRMDGQGVDDGHLIVLGGDGPAAVFVFRQLDAVEIHATPDRAILIYAYIQGPGVEDIPGGAKGFFSPVESRIAIQEGMSEIQTVKTAIHEIAHAKLHAVKPDEKTAPEDRKDRHTKEVEAESVAYTVCQRYGIETSDYSFGYIAGWSSGKETKELKSSLDTIRKTAAEMIEGIDAKLKVLLAEKAQSTEKDAEAPAEPMQEVPIYRETANYAYEAGELEAYHASLAANEECRSAIEAAISGNYAENRLDADAAVKSVLEQFSPERIRYVLANTIQQKDFDGRIPQPLKEWAKNVEVCSENASRFLVDKCNPGLTALFVDAFRNQTEPQKDVASEKAEERDPEVVAWENDEITSIEVKTVEVKSPFAPLPEKADAPKPHRLTPEEKKIKDAVMDTLKGQIAYHNDGMRSTYRSSEQSFRTMAQYKVKIEGSTVTRNGEPMFKVHRRHAARKTQGCYRELMPTLEYIGREKAQETKQEKPSIRDQLKAAAKSQPEKKAPAKQKSHDIGLE